MSFNRLATWQQCLLCPSVWQQQWVPLHYWRPRLGFRTVRNTSLATPEVVTCKCLIIKSSFKTNLLQLWGIPLSFGLFLRPSKLPIYCMTTYKTTHSNVLIPSFPVDRPATLSGTNTGPRAVYELGTSEVIQSPSCQHKSAISSTDRVGNGRGGTVGRN